MRTLLSLVGKPFSNAVLATEFRTTWAQYSILDFSKTDEALKYFVDILIGIRFKFFALSTTQRNSAIRSINILLNDPTSIGTLDCSNLSYSLCLGRSNWTQWRIPIRVVEQIWCFTHGNDIVIFINIILHGIALESILTVLSDIVLDCIVNVSLGVPINTKSSQIHAGFHLLSSVSVHVFFLAGVWGPIFVLIIITNAIFIDISLKPGMTSGTKRLWFTALSVEIQRSVIQILLSIFSVFLLFTIFWIFNWPRNIRRHWTTVPWISSRSLLLIPIWYDFLLILRILWNVTKMHIFLVQGRMRVLWPISSILHHTQRTLRHMISVVQSTLNSLIIALPIYRQNGISLSQKLVKFHILILTSILYLVQNLLLGENWCLKLSWRHIIRSNGLSLLINLFLSSSIGLPDYLLQKILISCIVWILLGLTQIRMTLLNQGIDLLVEIIGWPLLLLSIIRILPIVNCSLGCYRGTSCIICWISICLCTHDCGLIVFCSDGL